jgi:tRNA pseudouridine38-40 synthase
MKISDKYRYKITIEYLGLGFCGWQRQASSLSVQQVIEEAIFACTKERVMVQCSGRTDAGVNAYGQVAHFDLSKNIEPKKIMSSINHFCLPNKVGIVDCELVNNNFHSRFSAKQRHYVYKILNRQGINIVNEHLQYWVRDTLDIAAMNKAANYLLGKHDFSSFRASECQSSSPIKTVDSIKIIKNGDNIEIYVSALSFLHHMVRNIVGNLVLVGRGKWMPEKMKEVLELADRKYGGPTAPAHGLYFLKVDY